MVKYFSKNQRRYILKKSINITRQGKNINIGRSALTYFFNQFMENKQPQ